MGEPVFKAKSGGRVMIEADADWWRDTLTTAHNYELGIANQTLLSVELRSKAQTRVGQLRKLMADIA